MTTPTVVVMVEPRVEAWLFKSRETALTFAEGLRGKYAKAVVHVTEAREP